jgi:hypothetical protein
MITKDQLFVQGEPVASMAEIRDPAADVIEPLRQVLQRPLLASGEAAIEDALAMREITVLADKSLPYDVVKKVMSTCTAASYGRISLAVLEKETPVALAGLNPA